jgi:membrane protein DedA with SNARE-associated domain
MITTLLEQIRAVLEQIILNFGYVGIALAMFVENLFPPIPSEAILLFAGFLAGEGQLSLWGVTLAATLGSLLGTAIIYYIGVWGDERILRRFLRRYGRFFLVNEAQLDQSLRVFRRYGDAMIFFGRMVPMVRSLISLPAGLNRMPLGKFWMLTSLGSLLWNGILGVTGVLLGQNWQRMLAFTEQYEKVVLLGLVLVVLFVTVRRIIAWYRHQRSAAGTIP